MQAITVWLANKTKIAAEKTERSTNGLVAKLVKSSEQAADAAGHERGRIEGEDKAAILAKEHLEKDNK